MKTYLIQRGKFEDKENNKKGLDSIVELDYMGSSEFEWGALPKSLVRIRKQINNYDCFDIVVGDKTVTVFCQELHLSNIEQYLSDIAQNKMRLKEFSAFDSYINNDETFRNRFDFWWDIENDLMFWKKNEKFETKFRNVIAIKPS